MTLRDLIAAHLDRFHPQSWYDREAFLDTMTNGEPCRPPVNIKYPGCVPARDEFRLPRAVDLVQSFLAYPEHPVWGKYLWCRDTDRHGQRIYVGGVSESNGYKLEIHRHLHLTNQWGTPTWG